MPRHKDLKRLVRARMAKTGESYTSARAAITATPHGRAPTDADAAALAHALRARGVLNAQTGRPFAVHELFGIGGGIGITYFVFRYEAAGPRDVGHHLVGARVVAAQIRHQSATATPPRELHR